MHASTPSRCSSDHESPTMVTGLYAETSDITIVNCTMYGNAALTDSYGGVAVFTGANLVATNILFQANSAGADDFCIPTHTLTKPV